MKKLTPLLSAFLLVAAGGALAQETETAAVSPLHQGFYLAPLGSYTLADKHWHTKDGYGGSLAGGYRTGSFALELSGAYTSQGADIAPKDVNLKRIGLSFLVFPLESFLPNLYAIGGGGYTRGSNLFLTVPDTNGPLLPPGPSSSTQSFNAQYLQAGLGHLFALSFGRYDFGIRAEALARFTERSHSAADSSDNPRRFDDYVFNLGLQLPLGLRPLPIRSQPEPVQVVPVLSQCSDKIDNDGDGKIDFPDDPGCSSADDNDETDPPQCSDGKDNDGDGLIDFPADKGCTSADDNDETDPPPPCKSPLPGERISLSGCGTGDVIVLRGVNFNFDKSTLTVNAKTLLNDVAAELVKYSDIGIELSGHTDSKGSDAYNQRLSEQRAKSVLKYLQQKGVATTRMTSVGFGESKPVADNATDEGRELNRRVELKIVSGTAAAVSVAPAAAAVVAPAAAEEAAAPAEAVAAEPAPAEAAPADAAPAPTP